MGYTHYWRNEQGFTKEEWDRLKAKTREIVKAAEKDGIKIAGWDGTGKPKITDEKISLNGAQPDEYETLTITPEVVGFVFCKTEYHPYDAVVVSILAAAREIHPAFTPSSDGGPEAIKRVYPKKKD